MTRAVSGVCEWFVFVEEEMSDIEITEVKKQLLEKGESMSFYRVSFRANGNLLYQDLRLNDELPDEILKQELARLAKRHLTKRKILN
jgi:hypothetical protein